MFFSLYRIIEGLVGPAHVRNLDHALTGMGNHRRLFAAWFHRLCTKDTTVMRESWHGITGVIYYIYSHCGFGRACASAQSRPSLHCLIMVNMVEGWHRASLACSKVGTGHHWCYLLHVQLLRAWSGQRMCAFSTMPALVVYKRPRCII